MVFIGGIGFGWSCDIPGAILLPKFIEGEGYWYGIVFVIWGGGGRCKLGIWDCGCNKWEFCGRG